MCTFVFPEMPRKKLILVDLVNTLPILQPNRLFVKKISNRKTANRTVFGYGQTKNHVAIRNAAFFRKVLQYFLYEILTSNEEMHFIGK